MVSIYQTTDDGRHICPNCNQAYVPEYDSKEAAPENTAAREQYISGICSDKCWNQYLGI